MHLKYDLHINIIARKIKFGLHISFADYCAEKF